MCFKMDTSMYVHIYPSLHDQEMCILGVLKTIGFLLILHA